MMHAGLRDGAILEHDQPIHRRDRRKAMRDRDHGRCAALGAFIIPSANRVLFA